MSAAKWRELLDAYEQTMLNHYEGEKSLTTANKVHAAYHALAAEVERIERHEECDWIKTCREAEERAQAAEAALATAHVRSCMCKMVGRIDPGCAALRALVRR